MPVIAGTRKESVINKAREVLIAKKIPYTIKRTKTWFFISSTKPVAVQKALREAGLEMNPIITMHSIWCPRCGAIRTFKKKADDWICQKCGARLLMFKNPKKVKSMVHPEALESLARYKDDLKAGHTSAAEYWRGQAGAYFTANPIYKIPEKDLQYLWITERESTRGKSWEKRFAQQQNRELRSKLFWKFVKKGFPKTPMGTNDVTGIEKEITHQLREYKKTHRGFLADLRKKGWVNLNPLTAKEKREVINLANTQFAISRKYADQPVRSSFWYGRSVGMGKIAKMFNPKEKKWDPISEALEEEDEEDEMIGIEVNPPGWAICGRCGRRFHSWEKLNTHLLKVHKVRNPLTAIGSAALTGVGIGAGFKAVDYAWNRLGLPRVKKNPTRRRR